MITQQRTLVNGRRLPVEKTSYTYRVRYVLSQQQNVFYFDGLMFELNTTDMCPL